MTPQERSALTTVTIVQTAFLGDVLLALPMAAAIKQAMPWARIRLVTTPAAAAFVDGLDVVDEVIAFDKRGKHAGWQGMKDLAQQLQCDAHAVIVPHRSLRTALFVRALRPTWSCTFRTAWVRWFCTSVVPYPEALHDADRQLALATALTGVPRTKEEIGPIDLATPQDRTAVQALLDERGVRKPYVVVAPGSVWPTKRWPIRHADVLAGMIADRSTAVVVVGEASLTGSIREREHVVDLCGRTTLREAAAVIAGASAVVCNDSAPLHLASLQNIPVVAVFGPTVPAFGFGPYGVHTRVVEQPTLACRPCSPHGTRTCPLGTHACMENIEPSRVMHAMNEIVENI